MEEITHLLNNYLKGNASGLDSEIAIYMLSSIQSLPQLTRADIAQACHVSEPSVSRFCKKLGFSDFADFKYTLLLQNQMLSTNVPAHKHCSLAGRNPPIESVRHFCNALGRATEDALLHVDRELIDALSADIVSHSSVVCIGTGLSAMFGDFLNTRLRYKTQGIRSIGLPNESLPLTGDKRRTIAILVSQSGQIVSSNPTLCGYLRKNVDKIWLITQSETPLCNDAIDHILYLKRSGIYNIDFHIMLTIADLISQYCDQLASQP